MNSMTDGLFGGAGATGCGAGGCGGTTGPGLLGEPPQAATRMAATMPTTPGAQMCRRIVRL
jgi:hypothetical protein